MLCNSTRLQIDIVQLNDEEYYKDEWKKLR